MRKYVLILVLTMVAAICYGQDKVYLNNGRVYEGKIIQNNDSLVIIRLRPNLDGPQDILFYKDKIRKIKLENDYYGDYVDVNLLNGQSVHGRLIGEKESSITIGEIKGSKFGELTIPKNQIISIRRRSDSGKTVFLDIGFLRGAALIGAEIEFPSGQRSTIYLGGGFKGFAAGFNIFFNDNYVGPGLKFSYLNLGFGKTYAGSLLSGGFFVKMKPGLSVDLGLGYVVGEGNYNFQGKQWVLTYGAGLRF